MRAPSFRMYDSPESHGCDVVKLVLYTPSEGREFIVGRVVGDTARFRAIPNDATSIPLSGFTSTTDAAVALLPDDDFPETCVRCNEAPVVGDAGAFEVDGGGYSGRLRIAAPNELDDVCEDCLQDAYDDLMQP